MKYKKIETLKYTTNKILPTVYDESLSYSELLSKVIAYLNDTMKNVDEFKNFIDDFVNTFDKKLQGTVRDIIQTWQDLGLLDEIIASALTTDFSKFKEKYEYLIKANDNLYAISNVAEGGVIETTQIQKAINENSDKIIVFKPGVCYKVDSTINLPDNTTIIGYDSCIELTTNTTLFSLGNNVKIKGLKMHSINNGLNYNSNAIVVKGNVSSYKNNFEFTDLIINNFGGVAINIYFAKNVKIENAKITNIGYGGVMTYSSEYVDVLNSYISDIGDRDEILAYGVAFTMEQKEKNLLLNPKSKYCSARNNIINNIHWEGLDTHAGEYIEFTNNTLNNCVNGISIVSIENNGLIDHIPHYVTVSGNVINTGLKGAGIRIKGNNRESGIRTKGVVISSNTLKDCGESGNSINGALRLTGTDGAIVSGNNLDLSAEGGILAYTYNENIVITNNHISNTNSSTFATPFGIGFREDKNNSGIISNNSISNNLNINTYMTSVGIYNKGNLTNKPIVAKNYISDDIRSKEYKINKENSTDATIESLRLGSIVDTYTKDEIKYYKFGNGLKVMRKIINIDPSITQNIEVIYDEKMPAPYVAYITPIQTTNDSSLSLMKNHVIGMFADKAVIRIVGSGKSTSINISFFMMGV